MRTPRTKKASRGRTILIDEGLVKFQLSTVVRGAFEKTLSKMLDSEVNGFCGAKCYRRSNKRFDTRVDHNDRSLNTTVNKSKLKVPKLRIIPFESAIID